MKPVLQLLVPSFVLPLAASFALAGVAGCDDDGAHPLPGCDGGVAGLPADLGAGPADQATAPAPPDAAAAQCMPLRPGRRFTIVAVPDTQYLFDGDRGNADVLAASLHWVVDHACEYNIVFVAGLGDIVENAGAGELAAADQVYKILDDAHLPYSAPAGNHDVTRSGQLDSERAASEPYLERFAAGTRFAGHPGFGGASANGWNSWFTFEGAGQTWLLLALDWRMSADSMAWARQVIADHPKLPVILTMHELVQPRGVASDPPSATGELSAYGQTVWNGLINGADQVFLTVNGHFWPPSRTTLRNAAGHEVHLHLADYQDRYYGGSGMIRLYELDLDRGTVEVSTRSPYMAAIPAAQRNAIQTAELERNGPDDHFLENIDFARRFAAFAGPPPPAEPPPVAADQVVIPGTLAYWRFDAAQSGPVAGTIVDRSGHGNDLTRVTTSGGAAGDLVFTADHHPAQPSRAALVFAGSKTTPPSYLRTADGANLNQQTFAAGYTIEAFVRLGDDCCGDHTWMGVLSRFGTGADAGKSGDDPLEPPATLSITSGRGFQWASFPTTYDGIRTNWSHDNGAGWHHVAIVNDGHHSLMYVDGALELRNPRSESVGIAKSGSYWMVGAYSYDHVVDQAFYGAIGDVRIVDHALAAKDWMTARP